MLRHGKLFPVTGVLFLVISLTRASVLPEIENFSFFNDIDENAFADALKNPSEDAYLSTVSFLFAIHSTQLEIELIQFFF